MSTAGDDELTALKEAAAHAYQRVREDVIDQFPPGQSIDEAQLSPHQLDAVRNLLRADEALVAYRDRQVPDLPVPRTPGEVLGGD